MHLQVDLIRRFVRPQYAGVPIFEIWQTLRQEKGRRARCPDARQASAHEAFSTSQVLNGEAAESEMLRRSSNWRVSVTCTRSLSRRGRAVRLPCFAK